MSIDTIAIIGLGYVGLPLAVEFAKTNEVIGFDINEKRIDELRKGIDITQETDVAILRQVLAKSATGKGLQLSSQKADLSKAQVFIVTVPTPITIDKRPDMSYLIKASETIGSVMRKGSIVIYESTVYPGATEEICVPVIEQVSSLKFNVDFFVGYSPERINPGDKVNTLTKKKKVPTATLR